MFLNLLNASLKNNHEANRGNVKTRATAVIFTTSFGTPASFGKNKLVDITQSIADTKFEIAPKTR